MNLPGKNVAKIKVTFSGGTTSADEFSIVEFTEGSIDENKLSNYFIEEN